MKIRLEAGYCPPACMTAGSSPQLNFVKVLVLPRRKLQALRNKRPKIRR